MALRMINGFVFVCFDVSTPEKQMQIKRERKFGRGKKKGFFHVTALTFRNRNRQIMCVM
jgi:hypothetical protein